MEVLVLIAQGKTNEEIARILFLSPETIKSHVRHLLGKLNAANRAHAVGIGYRDGWLGIRSGRSSGG